MRDPIKWSFALSIPKQIRTAILNYIQFFTDFMDVTQNIEVGVLTYKEGQKIRVEFLTENVEDQQKVQECFQHYLLQVQEEDLDQLDVNCRFKNKLVDQLEWKKFIGDNNRQIRNLQSELENTELFLEQQKQLNYERGKSQALEQEIARIQTLRNHPQQLLPPNITISNPITVEAPHQEVTTHQKQNHQETQDQSTHFHDQVRGSNLSVHSQDGEQRIEQPILVFDKKLQRTFNLLKAASKKLEWQEAAQNLEKALSALLFLR